MTESHDEATGLAAVRITPTHLADGRELVYFDDSGPYVSGGATRRLDDPRPLPDRFETDGAPPSGPELRLDPLTGEWVAIAAHRMNRTFLPPADANPLAPAKPGARYQDGEIPAEDYDVVVFENRFPSLLAVPGIPDEQVARDGEELWQSRPAAGRCEVICFSSDPTASLRTVTPRRMRTIIEAWAHRTEALSALPGIEQVFVFENRGAEIGVTLHHPHGQIYALPYVAPRTAAMLAKAREHHAQTGRLLGADLLRAELAHGERIVVESEHWVAYVPFAARWPVEVHLVPRRDVADLPSLSDDERADLATTYLELLRRLDEFFIGPDGAAIPLPYISGWHQAPAREAREVSRLSLQIFSVLRAPGKLKYLAGVESGVAAWVNDTTPERIARRLQELA